MTRAQQRRHIAAALFGIDRALRERADAFATRESERRFERVLARDQTDGRGGLGVDPDSTQRRSYSMLAEAPPDQSRTARRGEARIIDITKLGATRDNGVERWLALPRPAARADLASEISPQLGACRSVATKVAQSEPVQRLEVERRGRPGG